VKNEAEEELNKLAEIDDEAKTGVDKLKAKKKAAQKEQKEHLNKKASDMILMNLLRLRYRELKAAKTTTTGDRMDAVVRPSEHDEEEFDEDEDWEKEKVIGNDN